MPDQSTHSNIMGDAQTNNHWNAANETSLQSWVARQQQGQDDSDDIEESPRAVSESQIWTSILVCMFLLLIMYIFMVCIIRMGMYYNSEDERRRNNNNNRETVEMTEDAKARRLERIKGMLEVHKWCEDEQCNQQQQDYQRDSIEDIETVDSEQRDVYEHTRKKHSSFVHGNADNDDHDDHESHTTGVETVSSGSSANHHHHHHIVVNHHSTEQHEFVLDNHDCCAICLSTFEADDVICRSRISNCSHTFHLDCLSEWLAIQGHDECPVCRAKYVEEEASSDSDYFNAV